MLYNVCFNPCSVGLGIQTWQGIDNIKVNGIEFQSLFCWIRDSDTGYQHLPIIKSWSFNPCSVGLGIQTTPSGGTESQFELCFNPCSVGLGIQTVFTTDIASGTAKFQSLFCWIRDSDLAIKAIGLVLST